MWWSVMVEHPYRSGMPKGIHSLHSPWPSPPAARRHVVRGEALPLNVGLQLASLMICTQQHTIYRPVASTLKYLKWPTLVSKVHISIRIFRYKTYTYQESTLFSEAIISNILLTVIICYISTYRCTLSIRPTPYILLQVTHMISFPTATAAPKPHQAFSITFLQPVFEGLVLVTVEVNVEVLHLRAVPCDSAEFCSIIHHPCRPCPQFGAMFRCPLPILRTSTQLHRRWWEPESNSQIESGGHRKDIMDYVPGCCWREYSFEGLKALIKEVGRTEMSWKERTHCDWEKISDGTFQAQRTHFPANPYVFETC